MEESEDWLVFAWAEAAPDPRQDPNLRSTGEFARVADRTGATWTVYELVYGEGGSPDHAYAVEVGPVRTLEDGTDYNHVLTYRPDRLVDSVQEPRDVDPENTRGNPEIPVPDETDTFSARGMIPEPPTMQEYPVATGLARAPEGLWAMLDSLEDGSGTG